MTAQSFLRSLPFSKSLEPYGGVLAAVAGGAGLGLATQPVGWWWLAWVSLVPLWVHLARVERTRAFWLGMLFGMVYHGTLLRWLLGMHPLTWMGIPWWPSLGIAIGLWLLVSATQAWVIGAWASLLKRSRLAGFTRVLYAVGVWVGLHWIWGQGETAFPWGDIAQTQVPDLWALQVVGLGGSALLTGLIVAVNGLIAETWCTGKRRYGVTAALLLVAVHTWGFARANTAIPAGPALRVGVIQGNIAQNRKWSPTGLTEATVTYLRGYQNLAARKAEVVLIPETAIPYTWSRVPEVDNVFVQQIRLLKVPFIIGSFDAKADGGLSTALFALDSEARTVGSFDKQHLVPLGEQIPLKPLIGWLVRKLSPLKRDLIPGPLEQRFETPVGLLAGGICFDSAFGEGFRYQVARGARLLVTATNDAWFGPAMAPEHHALDTLRAVETERFMVRASNNGTSGVIDPRGRTVLLTGWNEYAEFIAPVNLLESRTLYVQWGDWVPPVTALMALLCLLGRRPATRN